MEIARQNANSTFDLAREAFEAKSLPQLFELTLAHQRKQFELAAAQLKELSALTQKVVSETDRADPQRDGGAVPAGELSGADPDEPKRRARPGAPQVSAARSPGPRDQRA